MSEKNGTASSQAAPETPPSSDRPITTARAVGFSLGDIYGGGYGNIQSLYLALFWTTFCGLSIAQAQGIMGVATIIAAVSPIVFGALSDNLYRTRFGRKFGRRRPLMVIAAILMLLAITMWIPGFGYGYYFVIFFIWTALNQMVMLPYYCLSSEMTTSFEGRTKLQTMRTFFPGIINALLPLACGQIIQFMGDNSSLAYTVVGAGTTMLFSLCVLGTVACTWEKTPEETGWDPKELEVKRGLVDYLKEFGGIIAGYFTTLRVRAFQKHIVLYLLVQSFLDVANYCFTFFVTFNLSGSATLASTLTSLSLIASLLSPVNGEIFKRFGTRGGYAIGCIGAIVSLVLFEVLASVHTSLPNAVFIVLLFALQIVWMYFRADLYYLVWVSYPYLPDIDEMVTNERREGIYTGAIGFFRRVTQGIAVGLLGVFLGSQGFDAKAETQPASATNALTFSYVWIVVIGLVICLLVALTYNLNKTTHGTLVKEVERLKAGGSPADVDPEVRKVCESLTGVKYDKCKLVMDSIR
jgi:oligogalacturonide transporter